MYYMKEMYSEANPFQYVEQLDTVAHLAGHYLAVVVEEECFVADWHWR